MAGNSFNSNFQQIQSQDVSSSFISTSLGSLGLNQFDSVLGFNFSETITQSLFKKKQENIISLKDYSLQTSTYGRIITEVIGFMNISGNIIWGSSIKKETIYRNNANKKAVATQNSSTTIIRQSFAIAICKGKIDAIKAIYADGNELIMSKYNIKIYFGSDDQEKDLTLCAYLGNENISAMRGLCYVVFTDFPLEEFDGRMPNFTFDVVNNYKNNEIVEVSDLILAINIIPSSGEFVYDTIEQIRHNGFWEFGEFIDTKKPEIINNHTGSNFVNAIESLNELQEMCKNLKWTSLVACWFGDNLNAGNCIFIQQLKVKIAT